MCSYLLKMDGASVELPRSLRQDVRVFRSAAVLTCGILYLRLVDRQSGSLENGGFFVCSNAAVCARVHQRHSLFKIPPEKSAEASGGEVNFMSPELAPSVSGDPVDLSSRPRSSRLGCGHSC